MPRCMTSVSPRSRSASRYFARRRRSRTRRPASRAAKSGGKGKRRSAPPLLDAQDARAGKRRQRARAERFRPRAVRASAPSARRGAPRRRRRPLANPGRRQKRQEIIAGSAGPWRSGRESGPSPDPASCAPPPRSGCDGGRRQGRDDSRRDRPPCRGTRPRDKGLIDLIGRNRRALQGHPPRRAQSQ